jgi:hypothetical protein
MHNFSEQIYSVIPRAMDLAHRIGFAAEEEAFVREIFFLFKNH